MFLSLFNLNKSKDGVHCIHFKKSYILPSSDPIYQFFSKNFFKKLITNKTDKIIFRINIRHSYNNNNNNSIIKIIEKTFICCNKIVKIKTFKKMMVIWPLFHQSLQVIYPFFHFFLYICLDQVQAF